MRPPSKLRSLAAALCLAALAVPLSADVLVMEDGRRIEGNILEETATEVRIETRFGTFAFEKSEVVEIRYEKTREEIYAEKLAACETGEDFYRLGLWCEENKLRRRAEKIYRKAIEADPDHAGARTKLGYVRYDGEWMTPEERDRRAAEDFAERMRAKGLVEHEGEWVTPEEKEKLERGLMRLDDGRWVTREEYLRRKGLAERDGELIPRERALALDAVDGFAAGAEGFVEHHLGEHAAVIGMLPPDEMAAIAAELAKTRAWFDEAFGAKPGLGLFDGRLPEIYVFGADRDAHYPHAVDYAVERSNYVPEGWGAAVKRTLGFTWIDPVPIGAARQGPRGPADLAGHCYHNMGHILVGRLHYEGKLLPPWFEEGVAAIAELRTHHWNKVFCRSSVYSFEGSSSGSTREDFDDAVMRDGSWRHALKGVLERGEALRFDKLAQRQFSQLEFIDIAQSMAIVEWLESQPGALGRFHRELRRHAPAAPARLHLDGNRRQRAYDAAFQAACDMGFRRADAAWRKWFLSR